MSELSDEDRAEARRIAAEMPEWTDEQLDELARIAAQAQHTSSSTQQKKKEAS